MKPSELRTLIRQGAVLYVSHSGGRDSQAMYARIRRRLPHDRIVVVHADLGEIEWEGVQDHIRANIAHELHVDSPASSASSAAPATSPADAASGPSCTGGT